MTLPFDGQPPVLAVFTPAVEWRKGGEKQESGFTSAQLTNKQERTTVAARTPCANVRSRWQIKPVCLTGGLRPRRSLQLKFRVWREIGESEQRQASNAQLAKEKVQREDEGLSVKVRKGHKLPPVSSSSVYWQAEISAGRWSYWELILRYCFTNLHHLQSISAHLKYFLAFTCNQRRVNAAGQRGLTAPDWFLPCSFTPSFNSDAAPEALMGKHNQIHLWLELSRKPSFPSFHKLWMAVVLSQQARQNNLVVRRSKIKMCAAQSRGGVGRVFFLRFLFSIFPHTPPTGTALQHHW